MPKPHGVTRTGGRGAASLIVMRPADMRPRWDPDVLEAADVDVVGRYLLSTRAVQVLLGSEGYGNEYLPVAERSIAGLCGAGLLDWISVSKPGSRRPVRAFSRRGIESYFASKRDGADVPWHRMPPDLRRQLGIDY